MRAAIITVSGELLAEVLNLPAGAKVLRVRENPGIQWGKTLLDVVVEHDGLPEVPEGQCFPYVNPQYTRYPDGHVEMTSWGT